MSVSQRTSVISVMGLLLGFCACQDLVYFPGLVRGYYGYSYGGYSPYYDSYVHNSVKTASKSGGYRGLSLPTAGGYRGGGTVQSGGYRGGATLPVSGGYRGLAGGGYRGANVDYYDNAYPLDGYRRQHHDYY
ncbi:prisilkin-39 [Galendromus occidentalis]|uniref:Prisilkin-39 n=1 Tax=Galendromus occidentalis TaxID=34638 RepID=A0AAJ6QX97_9ACAR|nr:prisilkin-39 [Galendromus occidentalis]